MKYCMIVYFKDGETESIEMISENQLSELNDRIFDLEIICFKDWKGIWHFINKRFVKEVQFVPYLSDKEYEEIQKKEADIEKYGALKVEQVE